MAWYDSDNWLGGTTYSGGFYASGGWDPSTGWVINDWGFGVNANIDFGKPITLPTHRPQGLAAKVNEDIWDSDEDYAEFFVTPTVSWDYFPWDDYVDTSASVGVGLSYTTTESSLDGSDEKLMASMIFELEFTVPEEERWSFYTRLHHRSSAYGTFSDGGGSNFPSIGLRFHLN